MRGFGKKKFLNRIENVRDSDHIQVPDDKFSLFFLLRWINLSRFDKEIDRFITEKLTVWIIDEKIQCERDSISRHTNLTESCFALFVDSNIAREKF